MPERPSIAVITITCHRVTPCIVNFSYYIARELWLNLGQYALREASERWRASRKLPEKLFEICTGCISGVLTRFLTQPLDVIKLRTQLTKPPSIEIPKYRMFRTTRQIFKEEGLTAFWHGHNLGQIHSVLGVSSQFFVYELATKYVAGIEVSKKYKQILVFVSGMLAGCCSATLVLPLEVIRVRQMLVKEQYKGILSGAKEVYKSGGLFAFYEGLSASLLQMGPQVGISFCVFGLMQPFILSYMPPCPPGDCRHSSNNKYRPEYLLLATTLAGSIAGFCSKTATYPFDLAKRRMQIGSHVEDDKYHPPSTSRNLIKCKNLIACLKETFKEEGVGGLFRGWKVTIYKAQLSSIVAFTSYELMCFAIREISD